jgi:hypothetical protein
LSSFLKVQPGIKAEITAQALSGPPARNIVNA